MNNLNFYLTLIVTMSVSGFGQSPREILENLSAEDFVVREKAQISLESWAAGNENRIKEIIGVSVSHEDPEIRTRSLKALRTFSDLEYDTNGSGFLGISMIEQKLNPNPDDPSLGISITIVMKGGPAELAGIRVGDVITSIDGSGWKELGAVDSLQQRIREAKPGSIVELQIRRVGIPELLLKVSLGRRPDADLRSLVPADILRQSLIEKEQYFQTWMIERSDLKK